MNQRLYSRRGKRCFDVVASLLLMTPVSLLALLPMALILLEGKGPIFFVQARIGRGGRPFQCIKFRTMHGREGQPAAERITLLGATLRRWHVDEWPQLINVLLGQMSLVGPRPHSLSDELVFSTANSHYKLRHRLRPGITGLAQSRGFFGHVDGPAHLHERIRLDLEYADKCSFFLDLSILFQTVIIHFRTSKP